MMAPGHGSSGDEWPDSGTAALFRVKIYVAGLTPRIEFIASLKSSIWPVNADFFSPKRRIGLHSGSPDLFGLGSLWSGPSTMSS